VVLMVANDQAIVGVVNVRASCLKIELSEFRVITNNKVYVLIWN
jgi:hypothetical protein